MYKLIDSMSPTPNDSLANFMGEIPEDCWLCLVGQNRDSDSLTRSNFTSALQILGGESDDVEIICHGHWACGWVEYLVVREGSVAQGIAEKIENDLEDYPVVNDEHYSELEQEDADDTWKNCYDFRERAEYIRENQSEFEFRDFADMWNCVKGEYFSGYASEMAS